MTEGALWNSWFWLGGVTLLLAVNLDKIVAWAERGALPPPRSRRKGAHATYFSNDLGAFERPHAAGEGRVTLHGRPVKARHASRPRS